MRYALLLSLVSIVVSAIASADSTDSISIQSMPHRILLDAPSGEFKSDRVTQVLENIVARYESFGYLSVSAHLLGLDTLANRLQLVVEIVPGPISQLGQLEITGLSDRAERSVRRMLRSDTSATLDAYLRNQIDSRSDRFLTWTRKEPPVYRADPSPEKISAHVHYEAKPPLGFRALGGIGLGKEVALDGSAELTVRRIAQWDDLLNVRVSRSGSERQVQPIYRSSISFIGLSRLTVGLHSRNRVDQFTEFQGSVGLESYVSDYSRFGIEVSVARLDDIDTRRSFTRSSLRLSGGTEASRATHSNSITYQWQVDYISRSYAAVDSTQSQRTEDAVQGSLHFQNRLHFSSSYLLHTTARIEIRNFNRSPIPQSELVPIGGMKTLRGYRDEQFYVQNAVTVQIEPTVRFRSSSIFLFADLGYLEIPDSQSEIQLQSTIEKRFEYSYGLGLRVSDTRRQLAFGLGWGRDISLGEPRLFVELAESL